MTASEIEEARARIERHPKTPIDAEDLVGYELVSADLRPDDSNDMVALAHMIADHDGTRGRAVDYKLAEDTDGTLTLWSLPPAPVEY